MKSIGLTVYGLSVQDRENQRYELHNIKGKTLIDIIHLYESADEHIFCR